MAQKYDGNGKGYQEELISDNPDITLILDIPFDQGEVVLEKELSAEEKKAADAVAKPFKYFEAISYFKIKDKAGNVITAFDPPLVLTIEYSKDAWYQTRGQVFWKGRPRIFYLGKYGESWAKRWDEVPNYAITARSPAGEESSGVLEISLANLPDPRIGGC